MATLTTDPSQINGMNIEGLKNEIRWRREGYEFQIKNTTDLRVISLLSRKIAMLDSIVEEVDREELARKLIEFDRGVTEQKVELKSSEVDQKSPLSAQERKEVYVALRVEMYKLMKDHDLIRRNHNKELLLAIKIDANDRLKNIKKKHATQLVFSAALNSFF